MAADDEHNEVDGDGATGDSATSDYGDDNDYGDGRWTTTTMATARRATKSTGNEVDDDGEGATGDDDDNCFFFRQPQKSAGTGVVNGECPTTPPQQFPDYSILE